MLQENTNYKKNKNFLEPDATCTSVSPVFRRGRQKGYKSQVSPSSRKSSFKVNKTFIKRKNFYTAGNIFHIRESYTTKRFLFLNSELFKT